jgi:hypothetical protein
LGHSRSIDGNSERAYRVVKEGYGVTRYLGPYSTLSAAKGMVTREKRYSRYSGDNAMNIWIEQTPAGWEKVEN